MSSPAAQRTLNTDSSHGPIYTDSRSWFWPSHRCQQENTQESPFSLEKPANAHQRDTQRWNPTDDLQVRTHNSRTPTASRIWSRFGDISVLAAFTIPVILLAIVIKIPKGYNFHPQYLDTEFNHCNFDGTFTPYNEPSISLWNASGFFYINVAWGRMSFPTAKFIDVVWDNVVGRAGQAILAYITYHVSARYLAVAMREAPVPYPTYVALAFMPPTFTRTCRLFGDLVTHRGMRARLIVLWIVLSSLFVLGFSSFATAMAGYSSNTYAVMQTHLGKLVSWDEFQVVHFTMGDAQRIGRPGPVTITNGSACVASGFLQDFENGGEAGNEGEEDDDIWEYVPTNCSLFWRTVQYVNEYGLGAAQNASSVFTMDGIQYNLSSPSLNITTSYTASSLASLSNYLTALSNEAHSSHLAAVQDISPSAFWTYQDETYPWSYVRQHASCRYSKYHNWGFSFLIVFITSLFLAIWAIGTCALWLYTRLRDSETSETEDGRGWGTSGIYKSSWDLVQALKHDFGEDVLQPQLSEADNRRAIRQRGKAGVTGVMKKTMYAEGSGQAAPGGPNNEFPNPVDHQQDQCYPRSKQRATSKDILPSSLRPTRPTRPSLSHTSTTSSQAHILHLPLTGTPSATPSSPASLYSPSTTFTFSACIPTANASPVAGVDQQDPPCAIDDKAPRPIVLKSPRPWPTRRSSAFSQTSTVRSSPVSPTSLAPRWMDKGPAHVDPHEHVPGAGVLDRQTPAFPEAGASTDLRGKESSALEFRRDLGDD